MKQKRWMKSVLETSRKEHPAMPFQRGNRPSMATRLEEASHRRLRHA